MIAPLYFIAAAMFFLVADNAEKPFFVVLLGWAFLITGVYYL